jgi:hypothetical protein
MTLEFWMLFVPIGMGLFAIGGASWYLTGKCQRVYHRWRGYREFTRADRISLEALARLERRR